MKAFVSAVGNMFSYSVGKQCAEWRTDWNKSQLEEKFSLISVFIIPLYMLIPFNAMWLTNSFILFGFCLFLAPVAIKLIQWKELSALFVRSSLIAGLFWVTMMYVMFTHS